MLRLALVAAACAELAGAVFDPTVHSIDDAVAAWLADEAAAEAQYGHISEWNTAGVTSMSALFEGADSFNEDISGWVS